MTEIIDEINKEVAQERAVLLLKKYKWHIAALVGLIIAIVVGLQAYQYYKESRILARASQYAQAIALIPSNPTTGPSQDELMQSLARIEKFVNDGTNDQFTIIALTRAINLANSLKKDEERTKFLKSLEQSPEAYLQNLRFLLDAQINDGDKLAKIAGGDDKYAQIANLFLAERALAKGEKDAAKEFLVKAQKGQGAAAQIAKELENALN